MSTHEITIPRHLISILSFTFITVNLLFWLPVLLIVAVTRLLLPYHQIIKLTSTLVDQVYRIAVNIDAWWMRKVLGIRFVIEDETNVLGTLEKTDSPLIISNHRSWFDVFILQTLVSSRGPILKFLIKAELLWVPVLGWVCIALNFPSLKRKGDITSRQKDLQVAQSASLQLNATPGALLIFPEGTRFSEKKRDYRNSPYNSLLTPKPGGFKIIHQSLPESTMIIDFSIRYHRGDDNCWRCMSGLLNEVHIKVSSVTSDDVRNSLEWLDNRWLQKDHWLNQ
jgi:1-acyl-sn-glycerol-3-phosphate acyltransferase